MNWIKNVFIAVFSTSVTVLILNVLIGLYLNNYAKTNNLIIDQQILEFYKKYENKINHLRDPKFKLISPHAYTGPTDILFNRLKVDDAAYSVQITGDSWAQAFVIDSESYNTLQNYSETNKIDITLSGTSSYSPTLLGIQAKILNKDFNLSWDVSYIVIDNTDIGDELCRYREFVQKDTQGNIFVEKFDHIHNMSVYNHQPMMHLSKILNSNDFSLIKFAKLLKYKIQHDLSDKTKMRCGWSEISRFFTSMTKSEVEYFNGSVEFLIGSLKGVNPEMLINFITIPHKKHVSKEYKISVGNLLSDLLEKRNFENVYQIDLSTEIVDLIASGVDFDDIYEVGDKASHLTSLYHNQLLVPTVLSSISRYKK